VGHGRSAATAKVITSFVDPAVQQQLFSGTHSLRLSRSISADPATMRVSLWIGLRPACRENLRHKADRVCVSLFEDIRPRVSRLWRVRDGGGSWKLETLAIATEEARASPSEGGASARGNRFRRREGGCDGRATATGDAAAIALRGLKPSTVYAPDAARVFIEAQPPIGWLGELRIRKVAKGH
jgi:hypothetical protein